MAPQALRCPNHSVQTCTKDNVATSQKKKPIILHEYFYANSARLFFLQVSLGKEKYKFITALPVINMQKGLLIKYLFL